jgi:hypothetical protein
LGEDTFVKFVVRFAAGLALTAALLAPAPAHAGYETFKRSVGNILFAPLDLVLAPVTAGITEVNNLTNVEDTQLVQIFYAVPGYAWLTALNATSSVLRGATGFLELIPGIILLALPEQEMSPLFDPSERGNALVDQETPVLNVKFGVDYATPPS